MVTSPYIIWRKSLADILDRECETREIEYVPLTYVIILFMTSIKIVYLYVWNLFSLLSWKRL